jgi:hypothetical protein
MLNLQTRVARLERQRRKMRPPKVKTLLDMTDEELLLAAGFAPDTSDEEIEAYILAIDWDEIKQRVNKSPEHPTEVRS